MCFFMNSKHHPVSRPNCMPAPAIGCTTFCECTSPDRRPCVYHCKMQGTIQGVYMDQNALFQRYCGDNVCFQAASVVFCATISRLLRLKSAQNRCFGCKTPPTLFMNFKTHPVSRPNCMPAPAIGCTTFCESTSPDRRPCVYHCKMQGKIQDIYMDQNALFK